MHSVSTFTSLPARLPWQRPLPQRRSRKKLARRALNARIEREMPKTVPLQPDELNLAAGAQLYCEQSALCHRLPAQKKTLIATSMYRRAPNLLEGKGVTDDEPAESYWKVANGIHLTGMRGFRPKLSETQMLQASLLVANADKLPKSVHDILSAPLVADEAANVSRSALR